MSDNAKRLLEYSIWIGAAALAILALLFKPADLQTWLEYAGYAVPVATGFALLYERWLWRWNPLEKTPRLAKLYDGMLHYKFDGNEESKPIEVRVKQSLLRIQVSAKTDMNSSNSISATITDEHGESILYYQYRTAPDLTTKRENPMQYGASRMRIDANDHHLRGSYWTDRPSRGDMIWVPVTEEPKH